jgi:hypothetical protein
LNADTGKAREKERQCKEGDGSMGRNRGKEGARRDVKYNLARKQVKIIH